SATTTSTAPPTSLTRRAGSSARWPTGTSRSWSSGTSTWTCWRRCATGGPSTATGARTRTATWSSPEEGAAMTLLVKGGTVVGPTGTFAADVLVDGETIAAIYAPGRFEGAADTVVDATGKYVIPGEIDAHTHMELPFG